MKKTRILKVLTVVIAAVLAVISVFTLVPPVESAAASKVTESDWITPSTALRKCAGDGCDHTSCDYVYSFAVIGDTQNLNEYDVLNDTNHMNGLYGWIVDKQDDYNIQYVMGLGDITQSHHSNYTGGSGKNIITLEWDNAYEAISKLDDAKIGYSLVRGNHDISPYMNNKFGKETDYYTALTALAGKMDSEQRPMAGFLNPDKIEDTYRKVIIGDAKYIIFTLDYWPTEDCISWLDGLLTENQDYTAIITLHSFLSSDGAISDTDESAPPSSKIGDANWKETVTGGDVSPRTLWEETLRKHANVGMILCGHVDMDDIVTTQMLGKNGNTVTAMLIDGQTIDKEIAPVGLVTMFYFSADGKVVNVEHISTVRDLTEGVAHAHLKEKNQFELKLDYSDENGNGWTEIEGYGYLPTVKYTENTFHIFTDDDGVDTTARVYLNSYNTWYDATSAVGTYYNYGGKTVKINKTVSVCMSKDYTAADASVSNSFGKVAGATELDLGGNTFTLGAKQLLSFYNNAADSFYRPRTAIKNGTFDMASGKALVSTQQSSETGILTQLTFEGLTFNNVKAPVVNVINYDGAKDYNGELIFNVSNCTFNVTGTDKVTILDLVNSNGYENNDVTLTVNGGTVNGTTAANTVLYNLGIEDTVAFGTGKNSEYLTVTLTENTAPAGVFRNTAGQLLSFNTKSTAAPYAFTLEVAPVEETAYGDIPTGTYSAEQYPFALFIDGKLETAFESWYEFCANADKYDTKEQSNAVLYVRKLNGEARTITETACSDQLRNVRYLTLDLNGNSIESTAGAVFKLISAKNYSFTTNITVKNGTLTCGKSWNPLITINSSNTENVECKFNLTFDKVTITTTSTYQGRLVYESHKDGTYGTKNTLTFNDCTFDLTAGASVSKLFQMEESNNQNKVDTSVIINGGKALANTVPTIATFSAERESGKGSPDTLTFGSYQGSEFKLIVPNSVTQPTTGVATTAGAYYPMEMADDGVKSTYYYRSLSTKYADLSVKYLSAVDNPFVLFQKNSEGIYEFVKAYQKWNWNGFIDDIGNLDTSESKATVLLVRRDWTTTDDTKNSYEFNVATNITVDLDGHTLTRGENHLFQLYSQNTNTNATINVIGGSIKALKSYAPIVNVNGAKDDESKTSVFNITFTNVKFITDPAYAGRMLVQSNNNGTYGSTVYVTFNDCDVIADSTGVDDLFRLGSGNSNKYHIHVAFNGGSITLAKDLAIYSSYNEPGDSLKFGEYDGKYTKFIKNLDSAAPIGEFLGVNGESLSFADISDNNNAIYQLGADVIYKDYVIPFKWSDAEAHPFLLFVNGICIGSHNVWNTIQSTDGILKSAVSAAKSATDEVTVLMRRDYTFTYEKNSSNKSNMYNGFYNFIGKNLTVDLGENTLYSSGEIMKFNLASGGKTNTLNINVVNGSIVMTSRQLMGFGTYHASARQDLNLAFKDVDIYYRSTDGSTQYATLFSFDAGNQGGYCEVNLAFDNCKFDFSEMKLSSGVNSYYLFNCVNKTEYHNTKMNVMLNGGEVIGNSYAMSIANLGIDDVPTSDTHINATDTVRFGAYEGSYVKFSLRSDADALTDTYDSTNLTFTPISDNGTTAVYTLIPKAAVDLNFVPKNSITLESDLVFNIYIPAGFDITEATVNGNVIDLNSLTLKNGYYVYSQALNSFEAGKTLTLGIKLIWNEASLKGTFKFSIPNYAKSVLESSDKDYERTLIADVLAYIKSAYTYFENAENKEAVLSEINEILEGYNASTFNKLVATYDLGTGLKAVTFILTSTPTVRFYLTGSSEDYTFNKSVITSGEGKLEDGVTYDYVDISLYAYEMVDVITYETNSGESGSYHINSYLDYVNSDEYNKTDKVALIDLVERFYSYCKSSATYRQNIAN